MKFKNKYFVGMTIGLIVFVLDLIYFIESKFFVALMVISIVIALLQLWIDYFLDRKKEKLLETMFLNFVRDLVSGIKSGMSASNAIVSVSENDYGILNVHVKKLSNQVSWSIPLHKSFTTFAENTGNKIIKRSVYTVIEAEEAGGNIEDVLESITSSLLTIKKIKETREASLHTQVVQSYIIFFVFLGVMLIIQNFLVPYLTGGETGLAGLGLFGAATQVMMKINVSLNFSSFTAFFYSLGSWFLSMNGIFMMIVVVQGFFAGVVVGKLSIGNLRSGLKHSLILITLAVIIMSIAQG